MTECAAPRGSQRWLQLAVNRCPKLIDDAIGEALDLGQDETIEWLSPLESDCFREYRDREFLERLGITSKQLCRQLKDFWPRSGPRWDGLARTSCGRCLLVEAKANIPEFNSSSTAASPKSLRTRSTLATLPIRSPRPVSSVCHAHAGSSLPICGWLLPIYGSGGGPLRFRGRPPGAGRGYRR